MRSFLLGFGCASLIWVGVLVAQSLGAIDLFGIQRVDDSGARAVSTNTGQDPEDAIRKKKRRTRGRNRHGSGTAQSAQGGEWGQGESGDRLGTPGGGEVNLGAAGKEEQLSEAQIDRGIDGVFRGIERCLVLVPPDQSASGRVVVGMRIASSGRVSRVHLKGPIPLVKGETGGCIRRIVRSIPFPRFDGPEMVVHYPISFE